MNLSELNENNFEETINNTKGKLLIDCYATWCGPCKRLSPIIENLASKYDKCTFYKLDVDNAESISDEYNIMSIPTLLLFENGKLLKKDVGLKNEEELISFIES